MQPHAAEITEEEIRMNGIYNSFVEIYRAILSLHPEYTELEKASLNPSVKYFRICPPTAKKVLLLLDELESYQDRLRQTKIYFHRWRYLEEKRGRKNHTEKGIESKAEMERTHEECLLNIQELETLLDSITPYILRPEFIERPEETIREYYHEYTGMFLPEEYCIQNV